MRTFLKVVFPTLLLGLITFLILDADQGTPPPALNDYDNASLARLNERIARYPKASSNFYQRALVLHDLGKPGEAYEAASQAVALNSSRPRYYYLLAETAPADSAAVAVRYAEKAKSLGLDTAANYALLSRLYFAQGNFEATLENTQKALGHEPNDLLYLRQGRAQLALTDTNQAEKSLLSALDINPDNAEATGELASLYLNREAYDKALRYLTASLARQPDDKTLRYHTAYALRRTGQPDSAEVLLDGLVAENTDHAAALSELAFINYSQGQYDRAFEQARQAVSAEKKNKEALLTLARINNRKKRYQTALSQYQQIVTIDSTYTPAVQEMKKLKGEMAWRRYLSSRKSGGDS